MSKFKDKKEFLETIANESAKRKEDEKIQENSRWDSLKTFVDSWDVPRLPVVDKETWDNFYVPRLITAGAIPKKDLKDGHYYFGNYRNSQFGQWDATENRFHHWRSKHGSFFIDKCEHFEDHSNFAVFVPIREVTKEEYDASGKNHE